MATRKKTSVKTAADKYSVDSYVQIAKRSGRSLKVSTAKAEGKYPVNFGFNNGTAMVTSVAYLIAAGMKKAKEVSTEAFVAALDKMSDPKQKESTIFHKAKKYYEKLKETDYGNFNRVRNCLKSDIRCGGIIKFVPASSVDDLDEVLKVVN